MRRLFVFAFAVFSFSFSILFSMGLVGAGPAHADEKITVAGAGFATPESIEYYAAEDVYLVTNINGDPFAADGNGFISKVRPDGSVVKLKWIDGAAGGTTLNAPKGAAIMGGMLYVADIDMVRIFDLPNGKQQKSVRISGSTFLNGMTSTGNGYVLVSDTGLAPGFAPNGSDAVYKVWAGGSYETVAHNPDMGGANGVVVDGDRLVVVSFLTGAVTAVDGAGGLTALAKPAAGGLDGLVELSDGRLVMSSWGGSSIVALNKDGSYSTIAENLDAPADMGVDTKRNRLLVPLFKKNELVFLPL